MLLVVVVLAVLAAGGRVVAVVLEVLAGGVLEVAVGAAPPAPKESGRKGLLLGTLARVPSGLMPFPAVTGLSPVDGVPLVLPEALFGPVALVLFVAVPPVGKGGMFVTCTEF